MTPFFRKAISLFLFSAACSFSPRASAQTYDTTNRLSHVRNDTLMWSLADPFAFQTTSNLISRTDALSNGVAAANVQIGAGVDSLIAETDRARLAEAALSAYTNRAGTALQAGATNAVYAHYGPRVSALEALTNAAATALQPAATNAVYAFYDPLILALAGYTNTAATALQAGATNAVYAYYNPRISALAAYTNKADTALQPASTNGWNTLPFLDWVLRSEVVGLVASAVEDQLSADLDQLPGFSNTVYSAVLPKLGEWWHTNAPATPASYFTYETNGLGEIVITGYAPPRAEKRVGIPARIDGRPVVGVGYAAFSANGGRIESLALPETLRDIGAQAFPNMTSLNSRLTVPASVTNVGDNAFAYLPAAMGDRMILFEGDMPDFGTGGGASPFTGDIEVTILRRSGTSGWENFNPFFVAGLATVGPAEAVVLNGTTNLVSGGIVDLGNNVELKSTQAGPRLALVEAETNKWRAAYGWGNHALAGYLTSFTETDPIFAAWLGSNTYVRAENDTAALAALAAFAQTNRVTRWQDSSDTNIWWSAVGGTSLVATVWGDVETTGWHFSGSAEILPLPYPLGAFGEAQDVWCIYDMMGIGLLIHYRPAAGIHYEGQIPFGGLDTSFTLIDYETGRPNLQAVYSSVWVYSPKASAAFNLTTGNVWQAVSDARLVSEARLAETKSELSAGITNLVTTATNALVQSSGTTLYGSLIATNQSGFASFAETNPSQTYMPLGAGTGASTNTAYFQWPVSGGRVLSASTVAYLSPGSLGVLATSTLSVYDGSGILLTSNVMSTTITAWGELPFLTNTIANAAVPSNGTIRLSVTVIKTAAQSGARLYVGGVTPLSLNLAQTMSFYSTAQENEALRERTSHVLAQWYDDTGVVTQQILRAGDSIVTNRWGPHGATNITDGVTDGTYDDATRRLNVSAITAKLVTPSGVTNIVAGLGVVTNGQLLVSIGALNVISADGNGIITIDSYGGGNGYSLTLTENRISTGSGYNDGQHGLQLQPNGGHVGIGSLFAREALDVVGNGLFSGTNTAAAFYQSAPDAWIAATNLSSQSVTLTNLYERPHYLYATGDVSLAFESLRQLQPLKLIVFGPDSLTFPSNTHFVGGAFWQTNQYNMFFVSAAGTNIMVTPYTTWR